MFIVHLTPAQSERLAEQPESGMGYQVVRVTLTSGEQYSNIMVVNGRHLYVYADIPRFTAGDVLNIEVVKDV